MTRVYLAGPMSGMPNYNYDRFASLAGKIREHGITVYNPAENFGGDQTLEIHHYLVTDVAQIVAADGVAVMDGWEKSKGASLEAHLAYYLRKPVYDAEVLAASGRFDILDITPAVGRHGVFASAAPGSQSEAVAMDNVHRLPDRAKEAAEGRFKASLARDRGQRRLAPEDMDPDASRSEATWGHSGRQVNIKGINVQAPAPDCARVKLVERMELHALMRGDHDTADSWRAVLNGGGYKASMDDPAKLPLGLIPRSLYEALGRSLGHGAKKYEPHNFRKGMAWSQPLNAILRHLTAWNDGEDIDADSGNNHLDNAAAMLCFLVEFVAHPEMYARFDDRFRRAEMKGSA